MDKKYAEIIGLFGNRIKLNEPMSEHTTFKIGGPADLFFEAGTEEELVRVVRLVREMGIQYFILGGGSNILVGDKGFRGLIIKTQNSKLKTQNLNSPQEFLQNSTGQAKFKIVAGAGLVLSSLVNKSLELSVTGLEFAAGIPGTVGGAIRGNAGAWQQAIGNFIEKVKIIAQDGTIKNLPQRDCDFSYRDSRFKHSREIILKAVFVLPVGDKKQIAATINQNLAKRSVQPEEPSAGCVFVNPEGESAGVLIEKCNLKGLRVGGAQISEKHANFIVNIGGAKASDVVSLINTAKKAVKEKFNIDLKEEIVRMGEF